ncbi:MAG TPA: 5-(carboxyamino)imidazole ribonucleotide synthase [Gemmatimonadales bacterium]|nr:5-(carboxyamino)imidazole ribonucleotide synthase [Gemmatimonadales bacterium]
MILPGASLGVLGGGQLGRMFTMRAREMGYRVVVLEPDPRSPAGAVADRHLCAAYDDVAALDVVASECAAVTVEFENVPKRALDRLAHRVPLRPSAEALAVAQDRVREKTFLRRHGFGTAPFVAVTGSDQLAGALETVGPPALLKTSRLGYDGKGQQTVRTVDELEAAFRNFDAAPCVLERQLDLEAELSVVLARGTDGVTVPFPAGENRHHDGILDTTVVPARIGQALATAAADLAGTLAERLEYVGVLGVELFVADGGTLFVNEIAPRPHNSGHYTLDACITDQFEQQVRALCELPLGSPALLSPVAMINVLGDVWAGGPPRWDRALALPGVKLHLYGKADPRPGRKMGHLNCMAATADDALALARRAHAALLDHPSP